jgi:hypothetical protein
MLILRTLPLFSSAPDTTPPVITSANTANVFENVALAHALTANESVTWSIVGGADQSDFEISGSTLRWLGNGSKNYEVPDDSDTDGDYVVQVRATDLAGNTTDQTITVTVLDNAAEGGAKFDSTTVKFDSTAHTMDAV